jgi:dihydroneopterin aldolase
MRLRRKFSVRLRTIANLHPTQTGFWRQPEPPLHGDPGNPSVSYFLASDDRPVSENSPCWRMALPLSLADVVKSDEPAACAVVTYGDYFAAVHRFLEGQRFALLTGAVRECLGQSVTAADLGTIRIYLEKHGEFYHPARLTVAVANRRPAFVVNVAVTKIGRSYLRADFDNIRLLNDRFPYRFLPQVYCKGEATLPGRSR